MFIAAAMHRDPQVVFQHIRDLPMRVSVIDTLGRESGCLERLEELSTWGWFNKRLSLSPRDWRRKFGVTSTLRDWSRSMYRY